MRVFEGRNVHALFPMVIQALLREGVRRESRNGPVLMFPEPVTTVYRRPMERVLFHPQRDANPFFHLMESLWMLAGRNDVTFVSNFVKRITNYSDDGVTFHGAYGYRWRRHWPLVCMDFVRGDEGRPIRRQADQLSIIIDRLQKDPDDRRCVLTMWDPTIDLGCQGRDVPCNTQATFQINCNGELDMMVSNRSNDIIWGAYGANAVHFSVLHEYMARSIGAPQGTYTQVSANFHAYDIVLSQVSGVALDDANPYQLLQDHSVELFPLMSTPRKEWDDDLHKFMAGAESRAQCRDPFFKHVAIPMHSAHIWYKAHDIEAAIEAADAIRAPDWKLACVQWLERRQRS